MAIRGILGQPFMSLDDSIDLAHFLSLDDKIWEGIRKSKSSPGKYFPESDIEKIPLDSNEVPYHQIRLRQEESWEKKNFSLSCRWTEESQNFPELVQWLKQLPFSQLGRVKIFINHPGAKVQMHRDHNDYYLKGPNVSPHKHEFLWICPDPTKSLYIYDAENQEKYYINSRSAFFNEVDLHASDPHQNWSYSLKVDGQFSSSLRDRLAIPHDVYY